MICFAKPQVAWTHCPSSSFEYQRDIIQKRATSSAAVSGQWTRKTAAKKPTAWFDAPQLAKTRIATIVPRKAASCHGCLGTGSAAAAAAAKGSAPFLCRSPSSRRNRSAMSTPTTTAKRTAPTARAIPSCRPSTRAVRIMARTLIAGPE